MTSPIPTNNAPDRSLKFDKLSFVKYMKNIGRAYRKRATELVSICRTFVQAQEHTPGSDVILRNALQLVDDALKSASEAKTKTSKEVDEKFEKAIDVLSRYELDCHPKGPVLHGSVAKTVHKRMEDAKASDMSSSKLLNSLKEKLLSMPTSDGPMTVVEFLLFKSLPYDSPTAVVQQVLSKGSNLPEVLWNFSRCKGKNRLTLKENPHFYKHLPRSKEDYGNEFRRDPIENFGDTHEVFVLTDRPGRVYLESRAFGNVWLPKDALIFKDVCGKLEGESIVGAPIQGSYDLRYRVEHPTPQLASGIGSMAIPSDRSSTSPTNSVWKPLKDWREPILCVLDTQDASIHINTRHPKSPERVRVSPYISGNCALRSSNPTKRARSSKCQSSLALTQPLPVVTTGIPSNKETAQPASHSQRSSTTSQLTDRATPAPVPSAAPMPCNMPQKREPHAGAPTEEMPNISRKLNMEDPTSVSVTVLSGITSSAGEKTARRGGNAPGQANDLSPSPEHATTLAPKSNAIRPPLQAQDTRPAPRQKWQFWLQGYVWKG